MIGVIAEKAKYTIQDLPFIDKIGGLAHTKKIKSGGKDKKFPFYSTECDGCEDGIFTPDESKRSVIYFEEYSESKAISFSQGNIEMTADIACIGWLNKKKLGHNEINVSYKVTLPIIKFLIRQNPIPSSPIAGLTFDFVKQLKGDRDLFSKYNYNEFKELFNGDFEVFGLVFKATWFVSENCIDDFKLETEIC